MSETASFFASARRTISGHYHAEVHRRDESRRPVACCRHFHRTPDAALACASRMKRETEAKQ